MPIPKLHLLARERAARDHVRLLGDDDLVRAVVGSNIHLPTTLIALASAPPTELTELLHISINKAELLAAAFELGRRGAWAPPARGERCLDPGRVALLMQDVAHQDAEEFHVVLLDVRGRLLGRRLISRGSLSQCPVSPRDALRPVIREGAHSAVFVHNHPSGDPAPSPEDADLTERLRAASEVVGVVARDHVIVAADSYYSFVEAGCWRH